MAEDLDTTLPTFEEIEAMGKGPAAPSPTRLPAPGRRMPRAELVRGPPERMPTFEEIEAMGGRSDPQRITPIPEGSQEPKVLPAAGEPLVAPGLEPNLDPSQVPSMDAFRIQRTMQGVNAGVNAYKSVQIARAELEALGRQHPSYERFKADLDLLDQALQGPVPPDMQEAIRREAMRIGNDVGARVQAVTKVVPEEVRPGNVLRTITSAPMVRYPLKGIAALTRIIDAPLPAAELARARGQDPLLAATAAADPLGRFTPTGARQPAGSVPAPSWIDVAEEKFNQEARRQILARGEQPTPEAMQAELWNMEIDTPLGKMGRGQAIGLGLATDIFASPSTWMAAPKVGGFTVAGRTVVPESVKTWPTRALSLEGAGRAVKAPFTAFARTRVGDELLRLWDKYHDAKKIAEVAGPKAAAQTIRILKMREGMTRTQQGEWTQKIGALLADEPIDVQRRVADMIEKPEAFDWGRFVERAAGPPELPPVTPGKIVTGPAETVRPAIAGPGAVPLESTPPGAARMGAAAEIRHAPTPQEAELAGRLEDMLRSARHEIGARSAFRGSGSTELALPAEVQTARESWGRENYFPHERTEESLKAERARARVESRGATSATSPMRTKFGFTSSREEADWVNSLIDQVNQGRIAAARKPEVRLASPGRGSVPPVEVVGQGVVSEIPPGVVLEPKVANAISDLNRFWRSPPKELLEESGGFIRPEAERWLDFPAQAADIYMRKVTRAVNDYDAMTKLRHLADAQGDVLARPIAGIHRGVPFEKEPFGAMGATGVPGLPKGTRYLHGYRVPENAAWKDAFPQVAVPNELATVVEGMSEPYWQGWIERHVIRPGHRWQLPWKTAATVGAGFRFPNRNYVSQQMANMTNYGVSVWAPRKQIASHIVALPDSIYAAQPSLGKLTYRVGNMDLSFDEIRRISKASDLWQTLPADVLYGMPLERGIEEAPHAYRSVAGFLERTPAIKGAATGTALGAWLGGPVGAAAGGAIGATLGSKTLRPLNPFSREFIPTKHVFYPLSQYGERQGRTVAFLSELELAAKQKKLNSMDDIFAAAQRANEAHVDYASFSKAFEKYVGLVYPFAKWNAAMARNMLEWQLRRPGMGMVPERIFRAGEHLVPPEEREQYARERKGKLTESTGARLVGWPKQVNPEGLGSLKEPAVGGAKGGFRLPYLSASPFADLAMNLWGAPARIVGAEQPGRQAASEVLEGALPAWKVPYELLTERNVFTQEPIHMRAAKPAPRAIAGLYAEHPDIAKRVFGAHHVLDKTSGNVAVMTPAWVNEFFRMYPNVAAADLAAGIMGRAARPYDNRTAMLLRIFGLTQILHDPGLATVQAMRDLEKEAAGTKRDIESWGLPMPR